MKYVVLVRDIKFGDKVAKRYVAGDTFDAVTERERKKAHALTLTKPPALKPAPEGKPHRHVTTVKPPVHTAALKAEEPAPVAEVAAPEAPAAPEAVEPVSTDDAEAIVPRTYRTRRLKAED